MPPMRFTVEGGGIDLGGRRAPCAVGRGGIVPARAKREGDGATPAGLWPLRQVLFRPDRGARPATALPSSPLDPRDGWCDDPADPAYNLRVALPYPAGCEALWREDGIYDLLVVLGYNDHPVVAGAGSAIFLHLARPGFGPTEGCVALARADLEALLATAGPDSALEVRP
jgi:L,D-peptidoglycan transpeptidase YkuD (ErfK/YbiS/YcfS/YnhG family)